jgi:hypothetical protein
VRSAVILLFLAFCPPSLLAGSPEAAAHAGSVAPSGKDADDADAAFVSPAGVEQIRPKHETVWLIAGFTLDTTARGLDAYSTYRALKEKNNQEMFLPGAIVKSPPALYGFGASIVLTEYLGYRFLSARHHERIARWLPYFDAALVLPFAVHNLSLTHRGAANGNNGPVIGIHIR